MSLLLLLLLLLMCPASQLTISFLAYHCTTASLYAV
jgi:hypothetical protein